MLGGRDSSSKCKHYTLGTSVTRPRCTARWTQQNTAPWYLFDSTMREVGSTNVALGYSPLEATDEGLGEEEAQFDCFDKSCIRGFGDARHYDYGKTQWCDPSNRAR